MVGDAGEDLVEKQNAEVGLMPVVADEESEYGYIRSEEHTSELQSHSDLVCRLLLEKKKKNTKNEKAEITL